VGKAQEWLGVGERESIAMRLLNFPNDRVVKSSGRIFATCPFHHEDSPGGSFFYKPDDDVAHCYGCKQGTDLIGLYAIHQGKDPNDPDCFKDFHERFAPGKDFGNMPVRQARPRPAWQPREVTLPPELWSEKALSFVEHSEERLRANPEALAMLAAWGISEADARACRLGWNDRDKYPTVTSWGLPHALNDKGKEAKIALPAGLVIPYFLNGRLVKIKIRRSEPGDGPRYWAVKGGSTLMSLYGRPEWDVWVIVETERDAVAAWAAGRKYRVGAIGTGSVSARPDARTHAILSRSYYIANCLDTDQHGAEHQRWWQGVYGMRHERRPIPPRLGKDFGDAVQAGENPGRLILAILPSHVRRRVANSPRGGGQATRQARPAVSESAGQGVQAAATAETSRPAPDLLQAQESKAKPAHRPLEHTEGVRRLMDLLRGCSTVYAAANHEEGIGARGCERCPGRRQGNCRRELDIAAILMNDDAALDHVAAQPEGRLRG